MKYFIIALLINTALTGVCTPPLQNCLSCTDPCTAPNCADCGGPDANYCYTCNQGFGILSSASAPVQTCVACSEMPNCISCVKAAVCDKCGGGQALKADRSGCEDTAGSPKCAMLDETDNTKCAQCEPGYQLKDGKCETECEVKECGVCNEDPKKCEGCKEGFFLGNEKNCVTDEDAKKFVDAALNSAIASLSAVIGLFLYFRV